MTTTRTSTTKTLAPLTIEDANGNKVTLSPGEIKMMRNLGYGLAEILELRNAIAECAKGSR